MGATGESLRHAVLNLDDGLGIDGDPTRPRISVWYEEGEDDHPVSVSLGAMWGAQQRFLSLSPGEARRLARMLNATANIEPELEEEDGTKGSTGTGEAT